MFRSQKLLKIARTLLRGPYSKEKFSRSNVRLFRLTGAGFSASLVMSNLVMCDSNSFQRDKCNPNVQSNCDTVILNSTNNYDNKTMPRTDILDRLKSDYKYFIDDPNCVYWIFEDKYGDIVLQSYVVIMRKSLKTVTEPQNPQHIGFNNEKCTKYCSTDLEIVAIIDVETGLNKHDASHFKKNSKSPRFTAGRGYGDMIKISIGDKIKNSSNFISFDAAYFKLGSIPKDFTGVWYDWNDTGLLIKEIKYVNGRVVEEIFRRGSTIDKIIEYDNGKFRWISTITLYKDNQVIKTRTRVDNGWFVTKSHPNRKIKCWKHTTMDGKKDGMCTYWKETGEVFSNIEYENGEEVRQ